VTDMDDTDPVEDQSEDAIDDQAPASLRSRVVGLLITAAVLAVLVVGYMHVALTPVAPGQLAPKGHYGGPCWACHMVSGAAGSANGQ
jgi:hypothetical protein